MRRTDPNAPDLGRRRLFATAAGMAIVGEACSSRVDAADDGRVQLEARDGKWIASVGGHSILAFAPEGDGKTPRPFFENLHAPGGQRLTRHRPLREGDLTDHAEMHPGLWLAFGDLSGHDGWRLKARVKHDGFLEPPRAAPGHGSFAVRHRYLANGSEATVCVETFRFRILARPFGTLLLWDSVFQSESDDVAFGDQEEMGLAVRMHTPLQVRGGGGRLLNSRGQRNEKEVWGQTADWCDYSGSHQQRWSGITLMPHPGNFRPSWFHARDYGLLVANPFGRRAFTKGERSRIVVNKGESFRLRFGVLLHDGPTESSLDLSAAFADYVKLAGT